MAEQLLHRRVLGKRRNNSVQAINSEGISRSRAISRIFSLTLKPTEQFTGHQEQSSHTLEGRASRPAVRSWGRLTLLPMKQECPFVRWELLHANQ